MGGALPGEMDRTQQGQPGRISFCCAENEADSPWTPLRTERGFAPGDSTVTVVGAEGTLNMNTHTREAEELLRVFALTMMHPPSNEYCCGGEPWLIVGPEHAAALHAAGYDKPRVRERLWALSKMPASQMTERDLARVKDARGAELGPLTPDMMIPISQSPRDIQMIVAGGPGTHSVYVPCFGFSRAVTKRVAV